MGRFDRILPGLILPVLYTVPVIAAREFENAYYSLVAPTGWHIDDQGRVDGAHSVLLTPLGKNSGLKARLESRDGPGPTGEEFLDSAEAALLHKAGKDKDITVSQLRRERFNHAETPCAQVSMERSLNGVPVVVDMHLLFSSGWAHTILRTVVFVGAEAEQLTDYLNQLLPSIRFKAAPSTMPKA